MLSTMSMGESAPAGARPTNSDRICATDEDLFLAASKGDEISFRILVDRHLPRVLAVASRMLPSSADADDVAQDAMLRIWTRGYLWKPGSARVSTWLHRVVVNLCIDRLRRRRFLPIETVGEMPDEGMNPYRDHAKAELRRAMQAALDMLPGKQKAAVILCHYEGFSGKEAAVILGVSVLALQSLLVRAKATLRVSMQDYGREKEENA